MIESFKAPLFVFEMMALKKEWNLEKIKVDITVKDNYYTILKKMIKEEKGEENYDALLLFVKDD